MTDVPDSDLVNLDVTIAAFIAPRIRAFRARNEGWPVGFKTATEWDAALETMQVAFERLADDDLFDDRVQPGLTLFSKHLQDLWI